MKEQWLVKFEELLWHHHTSNWEAAKKNPNLPYQLAAAYFDWASDGMPNECAESAFKRYLDNA